MTDLISSSANPLLKRIRALSERKHRRREGLFFVEGLQPVWQAVENGATITQFIIAPELLVSAPAQQLIAEQEAQGIPVARLTRALFATLSERDGATGLAALVQSQTRTLESLAVHDHAPLVVLHEVGNPGNLGTIIRTADASGAGAVILLGDATDPFAPTAVKASMGAIFTVPLIQVADPAEFFAWATRQNLTLITTSAHATTPHWATAYPTRVALLLGHEGRGLPAALLAKGAVQVRIPMFGTARSLNLAVAAGILLYEIQRQRPETLPGRSEAAANHIEHGESPCQ